MQKITLPGAPTFSDLGNNTGRVEIDGCYPGYGTTLGNTIRRVLLSSLPGSAVTSVRISGISHEFSTLPGVAEDIIQLILNLKKVRFRCHKDEPVKLTLKEKGVKKITAAQIQCPADVEVVTKNAPIATLTEKKSEIEMEIEVQRGLGYVPVEQQEREKKEIGLVAVDAIFTPIKRVNYSVENTRVGKRTDFDKISLEIETDGSISPREAYQKAIEIITEQFELIKNFQADKKEEEKKTGVLSGEGTKEKDAGAQEPAGELGDDKLGATVDSLSFSTRTMNVLEKNNIKIVRDLASLTEEELSKLEGMGEKGLKEIKKAIGNFGLTLKS
ncbi:MAG: DNA-directed RNA polymerase subunit alpha [Candidatus Moranbacteria bacterium RBG_13_45_13]|nr:MAG: DNA-directed RNA polymerase subunit alpha [Candidatus Moranbacteria bacterium RBG_13_45_13]